MQKRFLLPTASFLSIVIFYMSFASGKVKTRTVTEASDTLTPTFISAKDHKGRSVVSKQGAVSFSTGLDNDYYNLDSINRTGFLYIETKLDKFINEKAARIPLNLSIVIDHSGSMGGEKMEYAKKAASDIINKLMADDFVSVVIYDDKIDVIQPSVRVIDKNSIISRIKNVVPGGSTNLWGGTEKGYEQVKNNYRKNYVNRILLISDGLANVGITSNYEIKQRVQDFKDREGITLSSFGVGLDYNELLMTGMAESGAGNYYFIDSPDKMAALFEKELNGMLNVVAQNTQLKINLPRGVKVEKIFNYKYDQHGDEISIQFRDLFSEETKGVLIKFSIDDYADVPLKFVSTLDYDDISESKRKTLVHENILKPCGDNELYVTHFNKPVIEQSVLYIANENMENAMLEADKGDFNNARRLIMTNETYLKANKEYVLGSAELKVMDSINKGYSYMIRKGEGLSTDTIKRMQKATRAEAYKVRNKKGQ